jgi:hypothetical protein
MLSDVSSILPLYNMVMFLFLFGYLCHALYLPLFINIKHGKPNHSGFFCAALESSWFQSIHNKYNTLLSPPLHCEWSKYFDTITLFLPFWKKKWSEPSFLYLSFRKPPISWVLHISTWGNTCHQYPKGHAYHKDVLTSLNKY